MRWMDDSQSEKSLTLEKLRLLLFPDLSPEEGRLRIDAAFAGAQDEERAQRIERLANDLVVEVKLEERSATTESPRRAAVEHRRLRRHPGEERHDAAKVGELLLKASPLMLIGVGLACGYRANVWELRLDGLNLNDTRPPVSLSEEEGAGVRRPQPEEERPP